MNCFLSLVNEVMTFLANFVFSFLSVEADNLCAIFGHNLGDESWLVNHETSSELDDTGFAGLFSLLHSHVLFEMVVEHGVDEVTRIAVGSFVHLLKGTQIVEPV